MGETIGGRIVGDNGVMVQIGLPRASKVKDYSDADVQLLRYYCGHMKRVIELEGYIGASLPRQAYEFGLSSRYVLSTAEARLVLNIMKTSSLKQSALELNRSYHTVITQLKPIFHKTETRNQLELIKRLFSTAK